MSESSATNRLNALQQEHRSLKEEVRRLEKRAYLTPPEQRAIADLKKQKLAAKDLIAALRRVD